MYRTFLGHPFMQPRMDIDESGGGPLPLGVDDAGSGESSSSTEVVATPGDNTDTNVTPGAEGPGTPAPDDSGGGEPGGDPTPDPAVEKVVATRISQVKGQVEKEYQAKMEQMRNEMLQQFAPLYQLAQEQAKQKGFDDPMEYARSGYQKTQVSEYDAQLETIAADWGIDPAIFKGLIEQHPAIQQGKKVAEQIAKQQQQQAYKDAIEADNKRFMDRYKDLDLDSIPQEDWTAMFQERAKTGRPLVDIFNEKHMPTILEQLKAANAVDQQNNKNSTTPNPGDAKGKGKPESGYFSREQVERMSIDDIVKNYDAVMESQKHWFNT